MRSHGIAITAIALLATSLAQPADFRRAQRFYQDGLQAMNAGELEKAEELFLKARAAHPAMPEPEVMLGQVAMARNLFDEAEAAFVRAIELFRELKSNLERETARDEQDARDNLANLESDLEVTVNRPGRRGQNESETMRRESQKTRAEAQIEKAPDASEAVTIPADVYMYLGNARMKGGKLEPAIEAFREAVARAPDAAEPHHYLAVALAQSQKLEEALEMCRKAEGMGYAPSTELREQIEQFLAGDRKRNTP